MQHTVRTKGLFLNLSLGGISGEGFGEGEVLFFPKKLSVQSQCSQSFETSSLVDTTGFDCLGLISRCSMYTSNPSHKLPVSQDPYLL